MKYTYTEKDMTMNYTYDEVIASLVKCSDDNGNHWYQGRVWSDPESCPICDGTDNAGYLRCPCSRYGYRASDVAEQVWVIGKALGWAYSPEYLMGEMVNDADWPEQDYREYVIGLSGVNIDQVVAGYLEYQLWTQQDYDHEDRISDVRLDANYSVSDISPEYVENVRQELTEFVTAHPLAVRMYLAHRTSYDFGGDFYLTREGHGVGFWDRGLGELGDYLTNQTDLYGAADELWDDGSGMLVG